MLARLQLEMQLKEKGWKTLLFGDDVDGGAKKSLRSKRARPTLLYDSLLDSRNFLLNAAQPAFTIPAHVCQMVRSEERGIERASEQGRVWRALARSLGACAAAAARGGGDLGKEEGALLKSACSEFVIAARSRE